MGSHPWFLPLIVAVIALMGVLAVPFINDWLANKRKQETINGERKLARAKFLRDISAHREFLAGINLYTEPSWQKAHDAIRSGTEAINNIILVLGNDGYREFAALLDQEQRAINENKERRPAKSLIGDSFGQTAAKRAQREAEAEAYTEFTHTNVAPILAAYKLLAESLT
jgi:non-ribosomal peptide synthetase component F